MGESPIFASHYVLNDLLLTVDGGDLADVRRVCEKYVSRYKSDDELFVICNRVLFEQDAGPEVLAGLREGLKALSEKRKHAGLKRNTKW
jgi:hypothetical protein